MSQKDLANILGTDKAKKRRIDEGLLKEKNEKERQEEEEKAKKVRFFFQCTEVRFASLLSGGFTTLSVINPPEKKLANGTSVHHEE